MGELLTLLQQSIFMTSIDLDNATYTTGAIQRLEPEQQQFVRQIAAFVRRYPAINIVILSFLVLIGAELILQGLGPDFKPIFNAILVVAIVVAIIYHRQRAVSLTPVKFYDRK